MAMREKDAVIDAIVRVKTIPDVACTKAQFAGTIAKIVGTERVVPAKPGMEKFKYSLEAVSEPMGFYPSELTSVVGVNREYVSNYWWCLDEMELVEASFNDVGGESGCGHEFIPSSLDGKPWCRLCGAKQ